MTDLYTDLQSLLFSPKGMMFNDYSPKWRLIVVVIYLAAKWPGNYPPLAIDAGVNSRFSIY